MLGKLLCRLGFHGWFQHPPGSPYIASSPGPLGECRRCGAVAWVYDHR